MNFFARFCILMLIFVYRPTVEQLTAVAEPFFDDYEDGSMMPNFGTALFQHSSRAKIVPGASQSTSRIINVRFGLPVFNEEDYDGEAGPAKIFWNAVINHWIISKSDPPMTHQNKLRQFDIKLPRERLVFKTALAFALQKRVTVSTTKKKAPYSLFSLTATFVLRFISINQPASGIEKYFTDRTIKPCNYENMGIAAKFLNSFGLTSGLLGKRSAAAPLVRSNDFWEQRLIGLSHTFEFGTVDDFAVFAPVSGSLVFANVAPELLKRWSAYVVDEINGKLTSIKEVYLPVTD